MFATQGSSRSIVATSGSGSKPAVRQLACRAVLGVGAATVCTLGSVNPALAQSVELTEFRDPNIGFEEAFVDFNASAQNGNQDQTSYSALADGFYNHRDNSAERVLGYRIDGFVDAERGPNEGDDAEDDFGIGGTVSLDQYLGGVPDEMFWFVQGDYEYRDTAEDDALGATVGVGYGRVWTATPLARALRIQEELSAIGLDLGDLTNEQLLGLSEIVAREDEYRARDGEDEYRGAWYSDMEQSLSDAGVLGGEPLSALGTVKLDEVLFDEPISARRHGWLVRAGFGFQFSDFSGVSDNDPKLTLQAEYAKPYGLRAQLIDRLTYEPVFGDNTVHRLQNLLSYTYEISDLIDWINTWDLNAQQADDSDDTRFIINTLSTTFLYHLTNTLDLGLTVAAINVSEEPDSTDNNDDTDLQAALNLRYRLR